MGPVETLLREAREKVKRGWCQGVFAKSRDGSMVSEWSPDACAWCVAGAIMCSGDSGKSFGRESFNIMSSVVNAGWLADWNDHPARTQEHAIAAFGLAIAKARRGGL